MLKINEKHIQMLRDKARDGWTRREIPQMHPYVWNAIIRAIGANECVVITMKAEGGRCKAHRTIGGVLLVSPKGVASFQRYLLESGRYDTGRYTINARVTHDA